MKQAAKAGFKGVELFFEDLQFTARKLAGLSSEEEPTSTQLLAAADRCRECCARLGIAILTLQPFLFYDGLLDREENKRRLAEDAPMWLVLCKSLGVTMIQVSANFLPADKLIENLEEHHDTVVADMAALADLGAAENPPVRFAYEALCFSTKINTWQAAWDIVKRANRPNLGIVLDTFNLAGRVWADPASPDPSRQNSDADVALAQSLKELVAEIDLSKLYYLQVADGEKMAAPLVEGHEFHVPGNPPRMNWSRNARCFMYEEGRGGYLPVEQVVRAVVEGLGYKGWLSLEIFSRTVAEPGDHVPVEHARRGIKSYHKMLDRLHL
ncbi:putative 3-dehydroshikimate dehydratase [Rosellinia necatrix]|uniref:Putative 3-dehydroshikimate dehydratase n=1 Tax=Rosellinia necatrix TaxID=77044 RepID=A0A1S7UH98_ROSNE|nr:putative 3-dehydroshikimate dehydratase [Rosellinia necatrix]